MFFQQQMGLWLLVKTNKLFLLLTLRDKRNLRASETKTKLFFGIFLFLGVFNIFFVECLLCFKLWFWPMICVILQLKLRISTNFIKWSFFFWCLLQFLGWLFRLWHWVCCRGNWVIWLLVMLEVKYWEILLFWCLNLWFFMFWCFRLDAFRLSTNFSDLTEQVICFQTRRIKMKT